MDKTCISLCFESNPLNWRIFGFFVPTFLFLVEIVCFLFLRLSSGSICCIYLLGIRGIYTYVVWSVQQKRLLQLLSKRSCTSYHFVLFIALFNRHAYSHTHTANTHQSIHNSTQIYSNQWTRLFSHTYKSSIQLCDAYSITNAIAVAAVRLFFFYYIVIFIRVHLILWRYIYTRVSMMSV